MSPLPLAAGAAVLLFLFAGKSSAQTSRKPTAEDLAAANAVKKAAQAEAAAAAKAAKAASAASKAKAAELAKRAKAVADEAVRRAAEIAKALAQKQTPAPAPKPVPKKPAPVAAKPQPKKPQPVKPQPKPRPVPAGYDPASARRTVQKVVDHLRARGRDGYARPLVKEWQRCAGLKPDGVYGRGTRRAMIVLGGKSVPNVFFAQGVDEYSEAKARVGAYA